MRYLLVNHIAAMPGRDAAHVSLPIDWARDLAAAGRAATTARVRLLVATPLELKPRQTGRRVDLVPDVAGFEHVAIPGYRSARTFLGVRAALRAALARAIAAADVVQLDHGGHPVPLGVVASREAAAVGRPVLWTLGGDALPASRLGASARTKTKRFVGRQVDPRVGSGLYDAIRAAARVVASRDRVVDQLRVAHGIAATWIDALDLLDADIADARLVSARHARLVDGARTLRIVAIGPHAVALKTAAVVRAVHHAWRLRVPVELTIAGDGSEIASLRALADELKLGRVVRFEANVDAALLDADVLVDASTDDPRGAIAARAMASGVVPIQCAPARAGAPVRVVTGDAVGGLTGAIVDSLVRREALAATMLSGVEWCRSRTVESSYRQRFALAAACVKRKPKHAA